jgi:hypothetical protein
MTAQTNNTDDRALDQMDAEHDDATAALEAKQIDRAVEMDVRADFRDEPLDLRPWRLPETLLRPQTAQELHRAAFPEQGSVAALCERELAAWRTVNRALTDRTDECRRLRYAYNELAQVVVAVVDALEQHEQADPHYTLAARTILEANGLV